jgi:hypothetical protein
VWLTEWHFGTETSLSFLLLTVMIAVIAEPGVLVARCQSWFGDCRTNSRAACLVVARPASWL